MRKHKQLWVAITDGEHSRIVVPDRTAGSFRTREAVDSVAAHKRAGELATDKPGRAFESSGAARHAVAPKHDPHELAEERFEHFVADQLNKASAEGLFDELVLIAPPKAMPHIRERLDHGTAEKLIGALTKDLIKVSDHDLDTHLAEWARPAQQAES